MTTALEVFVFAGLVLSLLGVIGYSLAVVGDTSDMKIQAAAGCFASLAATWIFYSAKVQLAAGYYTPGLELALGVVITVINVVVVIRSLSSVGLGH